MNDELEKIFKKGKEVRLNPSEKEKMRDFIISYARKNERKQKLSIFSIFKTIPAIISIVVIFSGIGVSFAAERALPGDILYPVKVGVNEEARGLVALSDEKKVKWLATVAERRIEETETLVKENRLDSSAKDKIEKNFEEKTKKIEEKLKSIAEKSNSVEAEEVSRNLENALERHEGVLKELSEKKSESKEEIESVLGNVKSFRESIRKSREGSEKRRGLLDVSLLSATSSSATSTEGEEEDEEERD
ncbi:hypothetical protein A2643_04095 [Candidatus Nomurabacteria bacterium RIFCSPHIGHO2_01_FULL_39_220]|nr:MAG: hypothetical protein A3C75_02910 [Candidatus Giovannonibacteria bacterium RIFCSPHIGHO2_02_FULL_44_31]OGF76364.1 MAG: hypothetical protein A3E62_03165 [Candidatus Giovannonibacteria bacterium RIFCSPHIGHO2_12_FULL_44_29]OGI69591.1 MAG: hypothetical protein A2643_04095 [Candidatus Nomurabacteria bacterium RIFCSPHIGHO2_01_FULL_39_220]OGI90997.1 MAG: hypothetical protein A3A06_02695 [Candidatus Nomurabacteria bacterium RIFCSPLOWO2_01_FULL_41_220]